MVEGSLATNCSVLQIKDTNCRLALLKMISSEGILQKYSENGVFFLGCF